MSEGVFGLTMLVVGMGGTLLTLAILVGAIRLLTIFLPPRPPEDETKGAKP